MRLPLRALAMIGITSSGCLFTDVGENLEQSSCVGQPRSFCDVLNGIAPTGDACMEWACDTAEGVCKIHPFDGDGDGAPSAMCAPAGVEPDCDDEDPNRTPKVGDTLSIETCDGVDNDCDTFVDEGAYTIERSSEPVIPGLVTNFSVLKPAEGFAIDPNFVYSKILSGALPTAHAFLDMELVVQNGGQELLVQSAASFLQNPESAQDRNLIAAFGKADSPGRPLVMGVLSVGNDVSGDFADLAGTDHNDSTSGYDLLALGFAKEESRFVGSYIDHQPPGGGATGCGAIGGVAGAEHSVRLFGGHIDSGSTTVFDLDTDLGTTSDPSPSPVVGTSTTGFLTALASPGAVELHTVTNSGVALATEFAMELMATGTPGDVDVAIRGDGTQVGVVYRDGCGGQTKIMLAIISRTGDGPNGLSLLTNIEIAAGNNFQRPRILARKSPSPGWLVSWEEDIRRGKLAWVSTEGEVIGDPYELLSEPGLSSGFRLVHTIGSSITAYAPGSSGNAGIREIRLECEP